MKFSVEQLLQRGVKAHKAGYIQEAEQLYLSILEEEPNHPDANHNLGVLIVGAGKPELSLPHFKTALESNPNQTQYCLSMIDAYIKVRQFDNASKLLQQIQNNGVKGEKLDQLGRQLELEKNSPTTKQMKALIALYDQGHLENLIKRANSLLKQFPQSIALHNILGAANAGLQRFEAAIESYQRAIKIDPYFANAHNNLGIALQDSGTLPEAILSFKQATKIDPGYAEAHSNLGVALQRQGDLNGAIASCYRAAEIKPDFAANHYNLGNALLENGNLTEAIESYNQSLKIQPDLAEAHSNLGIALLDSGNLPKAIESFKRALKINPDFTAAFAQKLHQQSFICDWDSIATERDLISDLGVSTDFVDPLPLLALEDQPGRHLERSALFAKHKCIGNSKELPAITRPSQNSNHLKIGYFSGDFHEHPVMCLIVKMLELHDRSNFEIQAFSYGSFNNDDMHARLVKSVDAFHDARKMPDKDIAELARHKGIDIAIDLTGYTKKTRPNILAYRAAPIQVSYLGYPGSMGTDLIDYLIADRILIPEENQKFYSEKIVYMPNCYQVSDNSRLTSETNVSRAELGLPEAGFVFCCFNNNYKITPREFDIWMRLLDKVKGSVLWLRQSNQWSVANLKKEAQLRAIDPGRLIFTSKCAYSEYLIRLTKADLFLDTFNYNAGAVANDALWCGLPVLTLQGQSYVARMASSLLSAIDLPELITTTEDDYERLALDLATNHKRLKSIKAKLVLNKGTSSLFDTERFTKNLETVYKQLYSRYINGEKPDHLLAEE